MDAIYQTITSYKESIALLSARIDSITAEINKHGGNTAIQNAPLVKRRYLLYFQVREMLKSVESMENYIKHVAHRLAPTIIIKSIAFLPALK